MSRAQIRLTGIALMLAAAGIAFVPLRTLPAGSFNFTNGECDFQETHPRPAGSAVSPISLDSGGALALIGGLLVVFSARIASEPDLRSNKSLEWTREGLSS
jgi:hypothetical protein